MVDSVHFDLIRFHPVSAYLPSYAVIGDGFRTNYNVSIDVLLSSGGVFVGARVKGQCPILPSIPSSV